jgi:hypothetical protein
VSTSPYVFSIFTCVLFLPFVLAHGLNVLAGYRAGLASPADACPTNAPSATGPGDPNPTEGMKRTPGPLSFTANPFAVIWRHLISAPVITTIVVLAALSFVFGTYARYPEVSSGYWGWQAGPRDMIAYYVRHADEYDEFYMEGMFNNAHIFLDFYIDEPQVREKAAIGGVERRVPSRRQLFGVTADTYHNELTPDDWVIRDTVSYPDGTVGLHLVEPAGSGSSIRATP